MSESDFEYLTDRIDCLVDRVNSLEEELAKTNRLIPLTVGDWIKVHYSDGPCFSTGDIGYVHGFDDDGKLWVDFSKHQGDRREDDGIWCVIKSKITRLETPNV